MEAISQEGHRYICLNNIQRIPTKLMLALRDLRYAVKVCGLTTQEM